MATDPCTGARLHDRLMVVLELVLELLELALSARHQRSHERVGGLFWRVPCVCV